ncbi:MAG: DUF4197 domain-containing protein [Pseudomonadota bacterium]
MRPLASLVLVVALLPLSVAASQWKDALGAVQQAAQQQGGAAPSLASLSNADIAAGLKAALSQGTRRAVASLGRSDGFWSNAAARIPVPKPIRKIESLVRGAGLGGHIDQLHLSLNRAAEQAVPAAADVFGDAVQQLTLDDVRGILTGPRDSATQYFKRTTTEKLTARFRPIVSKATANVGVAQSYKQMVSAAGPFAASMGASSDLDGYVTSKALDSLFVQVAAEEARIRDNPAARTSDIMKRVFAAVR